MLIFKDEMSAFKDQMLIFKDEMSAFKDQMLIFKDEMSAFKDQMLIFKDEMAAFKDEMGSFKDTQARVTADLNRKWGELANKMGTVVEDIVAPNIPTVAAKYFECKTLETFAIRYRRMLPGRPDVVREFDIIAVAGDRFFLNETKSTPRNEYLQEFVSFLPQVFDYFPEHKGKTLVPIFSSPALPPEAVEYLTRRRVYAMAMVGDTMDLLNFDEVSEKTDS
jgi:hypothetical protein